MGPRALYPFGARLAAVLPEKTHLFERTSPEGFDGVYYVEGLSASAPAGLTHFDDQGFAVWRDAEDPFITPRCGVGPPGRRARTQRR